MARELVDLAINVLREAVTTYQADPVTPDISLTNQPSDGPTENSDVLFSDGTCDDSSGVPETSVQLFYTARNMFEMFSSLVPVYHHQLLSTLPQLAGNTSLLTTDDRNNQNHIFKVSLYIKLDIRERSRQQIGLRSGFECR